MYRNNYKLITTLMKGCVGLFDSLMKRGITIKEVMADASTIHGEKICTKLLKMKYIRETTHNSNIYVVKGDEFIDIINKLREKF